MIPQGTGVEIKNYAVLDWLNVAVGEDERSSLPWVTWCDSPNFSRIILIASAAIGVAKVVVIDNALRSIKDNLLVYLAIPHLDHFRCRSQPGSAKM